jgi:protein translocase SecG subunit
VAVLLQTTKNEGLSGVLGGSSQSMFKGKKGFEETLQEVTNYLAVSFVVMSFLVSIYAFR